MTISKRNQSSLKRGKNKGLNVYKTTPTDVYYNYIYRCSFCWRERMHIYHGSQYIIEQPRLHGGKPYNDYGYGFYCTESEDMAAEWSVSPEHNGYVNHYQIDEHKLKVLNLNQCSILTWLAILLENRTFDIGTMLAREAKSYLLKEFIIPYEGYDIIIGYRADDSYFSFAQDFLNGSISYNQLSKAMYLGKMGEQVVLKSQTAFANVKWKGVKEVSNKIWLPRKENRDLKARIQKRRPVYYQNIG